MSQVGVSYEIKTWISYRRCKPKPLPLHLGVLNRVKHQFSGFGVPGNSVTEFLSLRETALCLDKEYTETAPCL